MTSKRTDIHRPSLADPAEYTFLAAFYQGASEAMHRAYAADHRDYEAAVENYEVFEGNHARKTTCDHCGAAFNHGALFLHTPTQQLIHIGHICADNTIGLPSKAVAARKRAERAQAEANERAKTLAATQTWRDENGDLVDFLRGIEQQETSYRESNKDNGPYVRAPHPFLTDMVHALNRYGSLTERQAYATRKFAAKAAEFAARDAQRAAEPQPTAKFPEGRITVTGEIVSTKMQDGDYGSTFKMLVKLTDGNKVWGTVPGSLEDLTFSTINDDNTVTDGIDLRGQTITFTATFEVSKNDEHFGFFKRPTKVSVVEQVAA